MKKCISLLLTLVAALCLILSGCSSTETERPAQASSVSAAASLADIPAFYGQPYVVLHDNKPDFSESDFSESSFERYSPLDSLGRSTANICITAAISSAISCRRKMQISKTSLRAHGI